MRYIYLLLLNLLPLFSYCQYQVILNSGDTANIISYKDEGDYYSLKRENGSSARLSKDIVKSINRATEPELSYSEVIQVEGSSKDELFNSARRWFSNAFVDSKEVLNISDKETGELEGKGNIKYSSNVFFGSSATSGWIRFTVRIYVKEGRYKYEFTNFTHEGTSGISTGTINMKYDAFSFGLITKDENCPYEFSFDTWGDKWEDKVWIDIKADISSKIEPLVIDLKGKMKTKINNDW